MKHIDPISQWKQEQSFGMWFGKIGTVMSITGDRSSGRFVLLKTDDGARVVRVQSFTKTVSIGDKMRLWLCQKAVLEDGRVMHGLIATHIFSTL